MVTKKSVSLRTNVLGLVLQESAQRSCVPEVAKVVLVLPVELCSVKNESPRWFWF